MPNRNLTGRSPPVGLNLQCIGLALSAHRLPLIYPLYPKSLRTPSAKIYWDDREPCVRRAGQSSLARRFESRLLARVNLECTYLVDSVGVGGSSSGAAVSWHSVAADDWLATRARLHASCRLGHATGALSVHVTVDVLASRRCPVRVARLLTARSHVGCVLSSGCLLVVGWACLLVHLLLGVHLLLARRHLVNARSLVVAHLLHEVVLLVLAA